MMINTRCRRLRVALLLLSLSPMAGFGQQQANQIMQEVVQQFVGESGYEVIAGGSWVDDKLVVGKSGSGRVNTKYKGYRYGAENMSDIDMRLVLDEVPANASQRQAMARRWMRSRNRILELGTKRLRAAGFGDDAIQAILARTSVYPPRQLMAGVENLDDAVRAYESLGGFPSATAEQNLRAMSLAEKKELAEGLYGEGAEAFTQSWEKQSGKHFFKEGKQVRVASADLKVLSEGQAKYTLGGSTNLSNQFAEKAGHYLHGQPREAMKNMGRLEAQMRKARSQAGLRGGQHVDEGLKGLMDDYGKALNEGLEEPLKRIYGDQFSSVKRGLTPPGPGATVGQTRQYQRALEAYNRAVNEFVETNRGRISGLLEKAHADIDMLRAIDSAGVSSKEAQAARKLLRSPRWKKVLKGMKDVAAKSGKGLRVVMKTMIRVAVIAEVYGVTRTTLEEGLNAGTIDLGNSVIRWTNLPAALVEMVIEDAKGDAMGMVATFQDCTDLMGGTYTVKGRERLSQGESVATLSKRLLTQKQVLAEVERRARLAAERQFKAVNERAEKAMAETEAGITDALIGRCGPQVTALWADVRSQRFVQLGVNLRKLESLLDRASLGFDIRQQRIDDTSVEVSVRAMPSVGMAGIRDALRQLDADIKGMSADDPDAAPVIREVVQWFVDGERVLARNRTALLSDRHLLLPPDVARISRRFGVGERHSISLQWRIAIYPRLAAMDDPVIVLAALKSGEMADAARLPDLDWAMNPRGELDPRYETFRLNTLKRSGEVSFTTITPEQRESVAQTTGFLRALVRDAESGKPVSGAQVSVQGSGFTRSGSSGGDGRVEIGGITEGVASLVAKHPDYQRWWKPGLQFKARPQAARWGLKGVISLARKKDVETQRAGLKEMAGKARIVVQRSEAACGFGDNYVLRDQKSDVGQKAAFQVPGKGNVYLSFLYRGGLQKELANNYHNFGGDRSYGAVYWSSPDGIASKGRLQSGSRLKALGGGDIGWRREVTSSTVIGVSGPGTLKLKVYPESTPARKTKKGWYDDWYNATHTHYHAAGCVIRIRFVGLAG